MRGLRDDHRKKAVEKLAAARDKISEYRAALERELSDARESQAAAAKLVQQKAEARRKEKAAAEKLSLIHI